MQEKFEVNGFPINDCVTGTVLPAGGSNKHLSSSFLLWLAYLLDLSTVQPSGSVHSSRFESVSACRFETDTAVTRHYNPTLV